MTGMLKIYASLTPLIIDDLTGFESSLGHRLPEDYRQFLLRNNGGFSNLDTFIYKEEEDYWEQGGVHRFFGITGIDDRDSDSLQKHIRLFKSHDETSSDLMPIANDGVGNFILLSIWGPDKGKVLYWQHEIAPEYGNTFLVAESFSAFLEKLYERDDEDD